MKLEQRVAATTVSMCPCGMASMTRVSIEVISLLTRPLLPLLELTSSAWYCLLLGQVSLRMNGLQRDHEPPGNCMQHIMCMCIFLGKGLLAFISHSTWSGTPSRSSEPMIWFFGLPLFLGYMLSQSLLSFCSLSPHPLGVPGAHLWPSPRLQAPFPAGYQPGGGLLPTHMHCAPGNTASASSRGLCLGLGEESREEDSPCICQGMEMKDIWGVLISYLTAAHWGFAFCSVELTPWDVIVWAASTSAFEDMGETCSPLPPGFQVALGLNSCRGLVGEWAIGRIESHSQGVRRAHAEALRQGRAGVASQEMKSKW